MKDNSLPRIMLLLIKGGDTQTSVNLGHLIGFTEAEFQGVMSLGLNETYCTVNVEVTEQTLTQHMTFVKGIVHLKKFFFSSFTQVVPKIYEFPSSVEHLRRFYKECW